MESTACELSNLDDIELFWEKPRLEIVAVFGPGADAPFLPTTFEGLERGEWVEVPILLGDEVNKENLPPTITTPVSDRPNQPHALL